MVNMKLNLSDEERRVRKNEQNKKSRDKVRANNLIIVQCLKSEYMKQYRKEHSGYREKENKQRKRKYLSKEKLERRRAKAQREGAAMALKACRVK